MQSATSNFTVDPASWQWRKKNVKGPRHKKSITNVTRRIFWNGTRNEGRELTVHFKLQRTLAHMQSTHIHVNKKCDIMWKIVLRYFKKSSALQHSMISTPSSRTLTPVQPSKLSPAWSLSSYSSQISQILTPWYRMSHVSWITSPASLNFAKFLVFYTSTWVMWPICKAR